MSDEPRAELYRMTQPVGETSRDWVVRGRIPPDAAKQIRAAIDKCSDEKPVPMRFIFTDWDALDPIIFDEKELELVAFVDVFPEVKP